jgi:uncharacterized membrane protein (DUF4010 family)
MEPDLARNFLIALAIGGLVGIEREMRKRHDDDTSFGGIRTYSVLALLGATSAWLTAALQMPAIFAVTLALVGLAVIASYVVANRPAQEAPQALGLTGEFAALAVFLLAAMAVLGLPELAVALSVAVLAMLAYKQRLHGAIARLDVDDLLAATKLLVASFIVLPLLPDRPVDPWETLNPYRIWLLVVLVSALSLVGYVAMRWLGRAHGLALTGVAGGLVSSTATTLGLARMSARRHDAPMQPLAAALLIAWLMMFARVAVLVAVVDAALLGPLALPLAAMAVPCAALAAWQYRVGLHGARPAQEEALPLRNPFSLVAAIQFGAVFAAVLLLVELTRRYGPDGGLYAAAALSGTVNVDAITLSMASSGSGQSASDPTHEATAIVVAVLSNTVAKAALVLMLGHAALRGPVLGAACLVVVAGAAALWLA